MSDFKKEMWFLILASVFIIFVEFAKSSILMYTGRLYSLAWLVELFVMTFLLRHYFIQTRTALGLVTFPRLFLSGIILCFGLGGIVGIYSAIEHKFIFPDYIERFIVFYTDAVREKGAVLDSKLVDEFRITNTVVMNFIQQFFFFGFTSVFISAILAMITRNKEAFMVDQDIK